MAQLVIDNLDFVIAASVTFDIDYVTVTNSAATGDGAPIDATATTNVDGTGNTGWTFTAVLNEGSIAQALPAVSQSVVSAQSVSATVSQTLPAVAQSCVVVQSSAAAIAATLPTVGQSLVAAQTSSAVITSLLPAVSQVLVGEYLNSGSVVQTLPRVTQSQGVRQDWGMPLRLRSPVAERIRLYSPIEVCV